MPQADETLTSVNLVANQLVTSYLKDAVTQVKLYTLDGKPVREVKFPGLGTASGFGGERTDTETFYTFSNYITPPSIFRYDLITGESKLLRRSGATCARWGGWCGSRPQRRGRQPAARRWQLRQARFCSSA